MKITINNEQTNNKELYYEETFWTGKRTIIYDGVELKKIKFNIYEYNDGEKVEQFKIVGNQVFGVTIQMFGQKVEVSRKLVWYEYAMAIMVFVPCVFFGAIGGAFGGGLGFTNLTMIRNVDKWWLKLIISVEVAILSALLSYIFASLFFKIFFT